MPDRADVLWFKTQFQAQIEPALAGTPLTVDFLCAIACQETGHIWPVLRRKGMAVPQILALCVGDTLDADKGRSAFPVNRAALLAAPEGARMFQIARQALLDMAAHIPGYSGAAAKPHKFCRGFGLFQRDLQFFRGDPQYFLQREYEQFDKTLAACLGELGRALKKLGLDQQGTLSDLELAAVGIAYNTGGYRPNKGLKQGHFNGRQHYGEALFDLLQLAHTVALDNTTPLLPAPAPGQAILPPAAAPTATGPFLKVDTREGMLRLRSAPEISTPPQANVRTHLPDGHPVRALGGGRSGAFIEVETRLGAVVWRGFASAKFLVPDPDAAAQAATTAPGQPTAAAAPVPAPPEPPTTGPAAVGMPRKPGTVTRRRDPASAHSLNEAGQPARQGEHAAELRASLDTITDWLAVDKPAHARYQPRAGLTFCNIYAHDFCHLAGVYLPRVWWTASALVTQARGHTVAPLIGDSITELRANDLFRWLREFGPLFGWRQAASLTELQTTVNQGAIGLVCARRKEDGRSGHIVVVVPETGEHRARRNRAGEVIAPLQSQAGASNFRRGTGQTNWWNGEQFAESACWLHA